MTPEQMLLLNLYRSTPRYDYIEYILKSGLSPNFIYHDERGVTPLILAIIHGKEYFIDLLIRYGANVNLPDIKGKTPLLYAIDNSANYVNNHNTNNSGNNFNRNANISLPNSSVIKILIEHDADVSDSEILHKLCRISGQYNINNISIIRLCLQKGAIFAADESGKFPYQYASLALFQNLRDEYNLSYNCNVKYKQDINYYNTLRTNTTQDIQCTGNNRIQPITIQNLLQQHQHYISSISRRELYVLRQYTFYGDKLVNTFVRNGDTKEIYSKLLLNFDRNQFIHHDFIVCPFMYSLMDFDIISCVPENYLVFYNQEYITPIMKDIHDIGWYRKYIYYYYIDLHKTIQRFPKSSDYFVVYRGVHTNYIPSVKNKVFLLPTFTSASHSKQVATKYGPIQYILYIHPECECAYMEDISVNKSEEEILINSYSRFVVVDYNNDQTVWKICVFPPNKSLPTLEEFLQQRKNGVINARGGVRKQRKTYKINKKCRNWRIYEPIIPHEIRDATPDELFMIRNII